MIPELNSELVNSLDEIKGFDEDEQTFTLRADGVEYTISKELALQSELIKTMLDVDKSNNELNIPSMKSWVLTKIVEYLKYHENNPPEEIPMPLIYKKKDSYFGEWDKKYIMDMTNDEVFELMSWANYLNIDSILKLTSAKIALELMNSTNEEIRKKFNIVNDYTPEEEKAVLQDYRWALE